ncbi:MAG: DNA polymerase III subunit chi [Brachymonas sp.]|nr:DNA polymerase III subunit chi [Brachymonas sp.]
MPQIAFHFNAPDKLSYACRLLRKASTSGSTVAVLGAAPWLNQLDLLLWRFSDLDFVPHGRVGIMAEQDLAQTGIWLCESAMQGQGRQVLVNFTADMPTHLDGYERVIEVVTENETDRQQARARWRRYTELGHEIVRHDLNLNS